MAAAAAGMTWPTEPPQKKSFGNTEIAGLTIGGGGDGTGGVLRVRPCLPHFHKESASAVAVARARAAHYQRRAVSTPVRARRYSQLGPISSPESVVYG